MIFIDNSLADAPVLGHLLNLATVYQNPDLVLAVFEHDRLLQAINSDSKNFGKLLMVGFLRGKAEDPEHMVFKFKQSVLSKILPRSPVEQPCSMEIEQEPESRPILSTTKNSVEKRSPYIVDMGLVKHLTETHMHRDPVVVVPKEQDYFAGRKMVKVAQVTKFVRPPNQPSKKIKKF